MLRTDDRLLLSNAVAPPDGHELDLLVATTYTLQLPALLAVPLSLTFVDWEDDDGRPTDDPVAALEAVRRYSERMVVFCQAGETGVAEQPPIVASWLEDVVTPVRAPERQGVFHPKVWVARYRSAAGDLAYRILCGSRNLTFDRSWDMVCVLDGRSSPRGGRVPDSTPLADFVATLPELAVGAMPAPRRDAVVGLAEELRRVRFTAPEGFDSLRFHPLGISGRTTDPLDRRIERLLVIAPFIGVRRLRSMRPERGDNILVSRAEEIELIQADALTQFGRICSIDDAAATDAATMDDGALHGLHAKLYVAEAGSGATVLLGSPNATAAGFERNVEFLVELGGRRRSCGIDAILGRDDDPTSLAALLNDVSVPEAPAEPDPAVALERELDALAREIAERAFTAKVTKPRAGGFDVELRAARKLALPTDVKVRCWPLTEPPDRHQVRLVPAGRVLARFSGLALESVTAFYAVQLDLSRDGIQMRKAFVLRAELLGAPPGRREAIIRSVLRDPERVLGLLRLLLAFDPETPDFSAGDLAGVNGAPWLVAEGSLLEALLRALSQAPSRIDSVAALVDDLADAGADVLPPGFAEVFAPIRAVREKQR